MGWYFAHIVMFKDVFMLQASLPEQVLLFTIVKQIISIVSIGNGIHFTCLTFINDKNHKFSLQSAERYTL